MQATDYQLPIQTLFVKEKIILVEEIFNLAAEEFFSASEKFVPVEAELTSVEAALTSVKAVIVLVEAKFFLTAEKIISVEEEIILAEEEIILVEEEFILACTAAAPVSPINLISRLKTHFEWLFSPVTSLRSISQCSQYYNTAPLARYCKPCIRRENSSLKGSMTGRQQTSALY